MRMSGMLLKMNEKAIEIIRKRIQTIERRLYLDRRYGHFQSTRVHEAVLRELRYILAKIQKEG